MTTHTPGPWSQSHREQPNGMWVTQVYDEAGETIADLAWFPVTISKQVIGTSREANARLIAAAPDLLAAAKIGRIYIAKMLDTLKHSNDPVIDGARSDFAKIEAAIAKATTP